MMSPDGGRRTLSRVAESIYWSSRYIERAENIARFIDVNLHLMLDQPPGREQWEPLIRVTADTPLFTKHYDHPTKQNVILFLTFDPDNPNSILRCLQAARENARSVREAISSEMWEQVNRFYLFVQSASSVGAASADPHDFFKRVKLESHLFEGIADATMSHGESWQFGQLGRRLERADKTSRLLDVKYFLLLPTVEDVGSMLDTLQWAAVLRSASALEMFRKKHGAITPFRVADFLIRDREFPRSIRHCLLASEDSLRAITGSKVGSFSNPAEQHLGRLCSRLNYTHIEEIVGFGMHEFLDDMQTQLNNIGDAISHTFFALPPVAEPSSQNMSQSAGGQLAWQPAAK
jgi:uncharacterized alpha-E superfamily protein